MKRIAIITGATGGLGQEFVKRARKENIDEIWAVGRNAEKLSMLKKRYGAKIRPVQCDLSSEKGISEIAKLLETERPDVRLLINNAGMGQMGAFSSFSASDVAKTIDLNCKSVCLLCSYAIPFMSKGARILNISSASSFQPNPYISIYSASKVFVRSFSRSLAFELKEKGISCTAVCPGWIDTDMLVKEKNGKKIKYPGMTTASRVTAQAMRDSAKGKDMSVCKLFVKYEHLLSKLMPQKAMMKIWAKGIKDYI